ncbi:hypothetical protein IRJ41_006215 [Triplophysa rosa]|uniref:Uncharacterized protein n=1 Tax=Triplophysa rosa TaxID=992332 RepID=A0A9W7WKZ0_TRIRA|nr:hypothetical protein IRJ41_006215 [Triplophysa rosa]
MDLYKMSQPSFASSMAARKWLSCEQQGLITAEIVIMASPAHSSAAGMISETTDPGVSSRPALEVL